MSVVIAGSGKYLPENKITNVDLAKRLSLDEEMIFRKTGIRERSFAGLEENTSDLAYRACLDLFKNAKSLKASAIDALILSTATPDYPIPGSVHALQNKLNLIGIPVYELRGGSGDFLKALQLGFLLINQGTHRNVLVVGADLTSRFLDFSQKGQDTSILFGDGAGAMLLTKGKPGVEIQDFVFGADGSGVQSLYVPFGGAVNPPTKWLEGSVETSQLFLNMDGKVVMLEAIKSISQVIQTLLERHGIEIGEIHHFVFHQANLRLLEFISKTLNLREDQVFNNIQKTGNTSNASIPICYDEMIRTTEIHPNDKIILAGFSAGFSYGACLIHA